MLPGVEARPDAPIVDDQDRRSLGVIEPAVIKARFLDVGYLLALHAAFPAARIILRSESEGYTLDDLLRDYARAVVCWQNPTLASVLIGYAVGNEINWRDGNGHGPWVANAAGYGEVLAEFFRRIGAPAIPLISPGLQRWGDVPAWVAMLDQFSAFWRYRGAHCYWSEPGPNAVIEAVGDAVEQASDGEGIVLEFNSSGTYATEQRVDECRLAQELFAVNGFVASVLFIQRVPDSSEFRRFVYSDEQQQAIVAAVGGGPVYQPISAYQLGPGFADLLARAGDQTGQPLEGEWTVTKAGEGSILTTVRFERGRAGWDPLGNYVVFCGHDGTVIRIRAGRMAMLAP